MRTLDFVRQTLPPVPARVLEVGCGQTGELASALVAAGYDVLGIDPMAPQGEHFRRLRLDDLDEPAGSFAAVVAILSLHHVRDLDAGVDRIAELLRPGGVAVVEEFGWDTIDEPTIAWLAEQRGAAVEGLREEWLADHLGLHGEAALLTALRDRLAERSLERVPTLFRELGAEVRPLEAALIEAGTIRALGVRWVGIRAAVDPDGSG